MHDPISDLLPILDQALADCVGIIEKADLEPIALIRSRIEARLRRPEDVLLVALAGGTGSGKSTLFNALAGDELAVVGGTRPTTSRPLALVPEGRAPALADYLRDAGVDDLALVRAHGWLCLIDLPDTDSVVVDHRVKVDSLIPRVDVVVWVLDPEKYRDASLHHGLIAPLADYERQFVFALNQVDRLTSRDAELVAADLAAALVEDGIRDPVVFLLAAQPPVGPPLGIEPLRAHLRSMIDSGAVESKMFGDLESAVARLTDAAGHSGGVDFEARWADLIQRIAAGTSQRGVDVAVFLDEIADEVGGLPGAEIREIARTAPTAMLDASPETTPNGSRRRFRFRARPPSAPDPGPAPRDALEDAIGAPVRGILARRARAQATITELALELRSLSARGS